MTQTNIQQTITNILIEAGISQKAITLKASLVKDLGLDSLDIAELIMEMECVFNVDIPMLEAEQLTTVDEAVNYISKRINF